MEASCATMGAGIQSRDGAQSHQFDLRLKAL